MEAPQKTPKQKEVLKANQIGVYFLRPSKLRAVSKALATQTQYVDKESGEIISLKATKSTQLAEIVVVANGNKLGKKERSLYDNGKVPFMTPSFLNKLNKRNESGERVFDPADFERKIFVSTDEWFPSGGKW